MTKGWWFILGDGVAVGCEQQLTCVKVQLNFLQGLQPLHVADYVGWNTKKGEEGVYNCELLDDDEEVDSNYVT